MSEPSTSIQTHTITDTQTQPPTQAQVQTQTQTPTQTPITTSTPSAASEMNQKEGEFGVVEFETPASAAIKDEDAASDPDPIPIAPTLLVTTVTAAVPVPVTTPPLEDWRIALTVGSYVDVLDGVYNRWFLCRVITHSQTPPGCIAITYDGYGPKWDEFITRTSVRLAPANSKPRHVQETSVTVGIDVPAPMYIDFNASPSLIPTSQPCHDNSWRNNITVGTSLDIWDPITTYWCSCHVLGVPNIPAGCIAISYDGFGPEWNEYIPTNSPRLSPYGMHLHGVPDEILIGKHHTGEIPAPVYIHANGVQPPSTTCTSTNSAASNSSPNSTCTTSTRNAQDYHVLMFSTLCFTASACFGFYHSTPSSPMMGHGYMLAGLTMNALVIGRALWR